MSRSLFFLLLSAASYLGGSVFASAQAQISVCTDVAAGATQQITGPDGVCYKVTNTNASSTMCVPTATTGEWQSFYAHPNAATLSTCQCAAGTASWLTNCSASVAALDYGSNTTVSNTASDFTGSATVTCSNGSYSYSSTSCVSSVTPGSQSYTTAGNFSFVVPAHNSLTVEVWGAGGGGTGFVSPSYTAGSTGGDSSWNDAVIAHAGVGGASGNTGDGGTATGGTTNTTGGTGGNGTNPVGGSGANGGAGGSGTTAAAGSPPGGGGGGQKRTGTLPSGGGGGGYSTRTYAAGTFTVGASVPVVVGTGGLGAQAGSFKGGDGAVGKVTISWN